MSEQLSQSISILFDLSACGLGLFGGLKLAIHIYYQNISNIERNFFQIRWK